MDYPKILSKKRILTAKLFDVDELVLEVGPGARRIHQTATRPPTVSVFPITDHEIYLISQFRYILDKTSLEAMSGFVEKDEDPLTAAKRELKEEMGIKAKTWKKIHRIELSASVFKAENHIYVAKKLEFGSPLPEIGEYIETIKLDIDEAVEKVLSGEINHAASIIGILMINKLVEEGRL